MGVAINFVIFPLSSLSEVGIGSCRFHVVAGLVSVSYVWPSTVQINKGLLAKVTIVSNPGYQMNERKQKSCQISCICNLAWRKITVSPGRLLLGYRSQLDHKSIYDLLNLAKLGSRIMACCLTATGHRSVCVPLQTIFELSLRRIPSGI